MAKKRKRPNAPKQSNPAPKRQKVEPGNKTGKPKEELLTVQENVLAQYYSKVVSLRQYLVSHLPATTKNKRRKIATFGLPDRKETDAKESDLVSLAVAWDLTRTSRILTFCRRRLHMCSTPPLSVYHRRVKTTYHYRPISKGISTPS